MRSKSLFPRVFQRDQMEGEPGYVDGRTLELQRNPGGLLLRRRCGSSCRAIRKKTGTVRMREGGKKVAKLLFGGGESRGIFF